MFNYFLKKRCLSFLLFSFLCLFFRYSFCPKVIKGNNKGNNKENNKVNKGNKGNKGKNDKFDKVSKISRGGGSVGGGAVGGGAVVGGAVVGANLVAQQQLQQIQMQQPQIPQVNVTSIVQLLNSAEGVLATILQNLQVVSNQQMVVIINQMLSAVRQQIQVIQSNTVMLTQMQIQQLMLFVTQINGFIAQIYQLTQQTQQTQQIQQVLAPFEAIMTQINLQINPQASSDIAKESIDVSQTKEKIRQIEEKIQESKKELQKLKKMLPLEQQELKAAKKEYRRDLKMRVFKSNDIKGFESIVNKNSKMNFYIYMNQQGKGNGNEKDAKDWGRFLSSPEIVQTLDENDRNIILQDINNKKEVEFFNKLGWQGQEGVFLIKLSSIPFSRKNNNTGTQWTLLANGISGNYSAQQFKQIIQNNF